MLLRIGALFCACAFTSLLPASPYRLAHTFQAEAPAGDDYFGTAVAIERDVVAIKSRSGYLDGDGISVTHVFEQHSSGGWQEAATFEFNAGDNDGNFFIGEELAIDGGVIAVGFGPWSAGGTSSLPVQVLSRDDTGWTRDFARLDRSFESRGKFAGIGLRPAGRTVGISGDYIIAEESGARRPDGSGQGVARVFQKQPDGSWLETANLFSTSRNASGAAAVAIDGGTAALVYRSGSTPGGGDDAGLYFFERQASGEWRPTESFLQDSDEGFPFFFRMIDIDGDRAATRDLVSGELTTYERIAGVWQETIGLPPTDTFSNAHGGFALEGDLLARTVSDAIGDPTVEVFQRDASGAWNLWTTINEPTNNSGLNFGYKLAFDDGRLLIAAPSMTAGASMPTTPGAAYLFVPVPEPSSLALAAVAGVPWARRRRRTGERWGHSPSSHEARCRKSSYTGSVRHPI